MQRTVLFLALMGLYQTWGQIAPLEPVKGHYKSLQELNANVNPDRADLDKISFPASEYSSGSIIYTMVTPVYLTPTQVDNLKKSVQYPANSSDQTRAELDFLLDWQQKRTQAQVDRSVNFLAPIGYWPHAAMLKNHERYDENMRHLFYEGRTVMGDHCNPENYPLTARLLEGVTRDMRIMEFTVKYHLRRARPYHLEPQMEPLARMRTPSFASGHTLWAYIQAFTWSELIPEKRDEFLELAYEVGESREIMGIHYPSDEEAARVLAHRMLTAMWENPIFREDLEKAKSEWK